MQFWMTSKIEGKCKECGGDILISDRMVYDEKTYKAYCNECGTDLIGADPKVVVSDKEKKEALKHAQSRGKRRSSSKK